MRARSVSGTSFIDTVRLLVGDRDPSDPEAWTAVLKAHSIHRSGLVLAGNTPETASELWSLFFRIFAARCDTWFHRPTFLYRGGADDIYLHHSCEKVHAVSGYLSLVWNAENRPFRICVANNHWPRILVDTTDKHALAYELPDAPEHVYNESWQRE